MRLHLQLTLLSILLTPAAVLHADVLDFTDNSICSNQMDGSGPIVFCIANGAGINQAYGDTAFINVSYQAGPNPGITLQRWDTGYSDLSYVAYGYFGANVASITLTPTAGYQVTLNSFNLGTTPPNVSRDATVTVTDIGTNTVVYTGSFTGANQVGATAAFGAPGVTSAAGLRISYGIDVFNVAIDNINFTTAAVPPPPPTGVPEPSELVASAAALLLAAATSTRSRLRTRRGQGNL
ncbi:hypothetical protein F183_A05540 [Bryobacterales bacterium F-183]|nr:hypothetical protein F183_A05540 [Bryobacterales bacterium F-183]